MAKKIAEINDRKITVEVSERLHKKATRAAKKQNTSLSQLVRDALASIKVK